jgi:hypothetical protein
MPRVKYYYDEASESSYEDYQQDEDQDYEDDEDEDSESSEDQDQDYEDSESSEDQDYEDDDSSSSEDGNWDDQTPKNDKPVHLAPYAPETLDSIIYEQKMLMELGEQDRIKREDNSRKFKLRGPVRIKITSVYDWLDSIDFLKIDQDEKNDPILKKINQPPHFGSRQDVRNIGGWCYWPESQYRSDESGDQYEARLDRTISFISKWDSIFGTLKSWEVLDFLASDAPLGQKKEKVKNWISYLKYQATPCAIHDGWWWRAFPSFKKAMKDTTWVNYQIELRSARSERQEAKRPTRSYDLRLQRARAWLDDLRSSGLDLKNLPSQKRDQAIKRCETLNIKFKDWIKLNPDPNKHPL